MSHFCSCTDTQCPNHPTNTGGCDRCVKKCLALGEIPSCFFKDANPDTSGLTGYTYADFAAHCLKRP